MKVFVRDVSVKLSWIQSFGGLYKDGPQSGGMFLVGSARMTVLVDIVLFPVELLRGPFELGDDCILRSGSGSTLLELVGSLDALHPAPVAFLHPLETRRESVNLRRFRSDCLRNVEQRVRDCVSAVVLLACFFEPLGGFVVLMIYSEHLV